MTLGERFKTFLKEHKLSLPIFATVCAVLWGSAFPAIKYVYNENFIDKSNLQEVFAFAGIRFTLAGIMVLVFVRGIAGHFKVVNKKMLIAVMLTQVVIQYLFFYWGMTLISGILSSILVSTGSFWWVLLAPLVDKNERIYPLQILALIAGFLGVCICIYSPGGVIEGSFYGITCYILATLSGTVAALMVRPLNKTVPVPFITGFGLFVGGLFFICISPSQSLQILKSGNSTLLLLTVHLAMVSAVAFSLWFTLVTVYDVPRMSAYRFLIPVFAVLESAFFLANESLTVNVLIGGTIVAMSVWGIEKLKFRYAKLKSS